MTTVLFERPGEKSFEAILGKVVAEGGAGVIQEARRADGTGAPFIVKRARAGGERLLEYERASCELVDHPSLVRYLGVSNPEGLGPLVAFEALGPDPLLALSGASMRPQWRDPGTAYYPLPPNRAIELAFDLLLAIEHLHERGLVHADVKLSNLLVRVAGELDATATLRSVADGRFTGVLIDLGSVRRTAVLEALTKGGADLTLIPSITPLYAPPEALFESASTSGRKVFSPAMDIYSFALVFYALLTGRIPYSHVVAAARLKEVPVVLDVKNSETRGAASPVDLGTLSRIPLHDVGFEGSALSFWPGFHAVTKEIF
ncbi:MAG: protein kinase, partial [Planctomycetota bacterium]